MTLTVLQSFSLEGKTAIVTGSAGLFGRQIAEALAEAGATTVLASRNLVALDELAGSMRERQLKVLTRRYDQGDESTITALLGSVVAETGGVDVLVNNAVVRPMRDWDYEGASQDFAESMRVNATGLYNMHRVFGNHMASRGGGSIVNIGSIQGMVGPDFSLYEGLDWGCPPEYFFHKGGLLQLTRFVAAKLGSKGVRVNALSPGGFSNNQDPRFVERYCARTFVGRMANQSDLKGAVVFLASDASTYITGTNLPVDGGYTSK
ncbi:MAG: SDR family oxidoreductase [Tardiphaga sp.]